MAISQVSAGRKNSLVYEIDGSKASAAWDAETPDHLWIVGHRDRANELLLRNPALMGTEGSSASFLPGGHVEGFADTFRALYRAVYSAIAGEEPESGRTWATFADGHRAMLIGDAIGDQRSGRALGRCC